jgi:hypothetical protein
MAYCLPRKEIELEQASMEYNIYADSVDRIKGFRTVVSLRNHTPHSKESIRFLFYLSERSPILSRLIEKRLILHWTPPVLPWALYAQEKHQIQEYLQLDPHVSITDHNCIE